MVDSFYMDRQTMIYCGKSNVLTHLFDKAIIIFIATGNIITDNDLHCSLEENTCIMEYTYVYVCVCMYVC